MRQSRLLGNVLGIPFFELPMRQSRSWESHGDCLLWISDEALKVLRIHWEFSTLSRRWGSQDLENPLVILYFESTMMQSRSRGSTGNSQLGFSEEAIKVLRIPLIPYFESAMRQSKSRELPVVIPQDLELHRWGDARSWESTGNSLLLVADEAIKFLRIHWWFPTLSRRRGNQGLENTLGITYFESPMRQSRSWESTSDCLLWVADEAIKV